MTNDELTDLRRWAARACGYERNQLNANTAARYFKAGGRELFVTAWLPDQNIAQAFEVLEVFRKDKWLWVVKQMPIDHPFIATGSRSEYDEPCPDERLDWSKGNAVCELMCMDNNRKWPRFSQYAFADSPAMAILLACKAASEAK